MKPLCAPVLLVLVFSMAHGEEITPANMETLAPIGLAPRSGNVSPGTDAVLEQGKELYAQGQYMAALDKFMKVLRRDPRQPEAREYLRLVVDEIRHNRGNSMPKNTVPQNPLPLTETPISPSAQAVAPASPLPPKPVPEARVAPLTQEKDLQQKRTRQLLTTDLSVIPGVKVVADKNNAQVEMETHLLFADQTGGLREEGVPLLDRVAAWLKTFGEKPVAIHCYPEENAEAALGGSLFLHRYAQLYGYFVEERKLSASRFVTTTFLNEDDKGPRKKTRESAPSPLYEEAPNDPSRLAKLVSSSPSRVVIVVVGAADDLQSFGSVTGSASRWLEFSIMAPRLSFNPDEGDWATLDLAALTPQQVAAWRFTIIKEGESSKKAGASNPYIYALEGKGNLLKRVSWDGRRQKEGTFVSAGKYVCKLVATNADGTDKTQSLTLEVLRAQAEETAVKPVAKKSSSSSAKPKPKKRKAATPEASAARAKPPVESPAPAAKTPPAAQTPPAVADQADQGDVPAAASEEDSSDAIWKQVIQFDSGESDLKPTLKASLERIGKTLEVYPLQKVRVMGYATGVEPDALGLAKERAERVRQTLISEYGVDPKRVFVAGGKVGSASKVEISITN